MSIFVEGLRLYRLFTKSIQVSTCIAIVLFLIGLSGQLLASSDIQNESYSQDLLMAVSELHGLSEEQAVDRMAKEHLAAIAYKHISGLSLKSYAGSWFDESSMKLKIAVADVDDIPPLKDFDVEPVLVEKSLAQLKNELIQATDLISFKYGSDSIVMS